MSALVKEINGPAPGKPCPQGQDVPVRASWKPLLEKVPAESSSQTSNHFPCWVRDLSGGSGGQVIRQSCGVWGPLTTPPPPTPGPASGSPVLVSSPGTCHPDTQSHQTQQQHGGGPHQASNQHPPVNRHLAAGARDPVCVCGKATGGGGECVGVPTGHTLVVHQPRASGQDLGESGLYRAGCPEGTVACGGSYL